jgi:hypothetical protein
LFSCIGVKKPLKTITVYEIFCQMPKIYQIIVNCYILVHFTFPPLDPVGAPCSANPAYATVIFKDVCNIFKLNALEIIHSTAMDLVTEIELWGKCPHDL